MAVSTVLKLQENRRDCYFSHVSLRGSFEHVCVKSKQDFVVLVDNAINSGDTLLQVKQALESKENVKPSLCLSMFDRMEYLEDGTDRSQQENLVGCPIRSAFSLIDLIEALEDKYERSSIIEYALDYGNKEILSYLSFRGKKV